ncbi:MULTISPECIES: ABC transporter ATP-binding protein [unclassified Ensifer]|uniref:ABC transporter ATP-binding protein n=1 Tax=unclassified Ensifer TaxID=2633371 RepID=UPI000813424B|nr:MULTISPECIES: ABC transporter ATP-binding protein [unclassified Ensifer]OCP23585.1 ABC transporter ATP-binding protein [Ensifer sp. LC384]OCP24272.1 ABC transporter ATP-binding protein [Ensifer sp. LC54]
MKRPKLAIRNATKVYGAGENRLVALDRINLDVEEGEFVSLVGPSGCGKTTLLWSIAGLHRLSEGAIELDGVAIEGPHPQIGMMFQEANLLPWRNVQKNIEFPFEIRRQKPARATIEALLSRVGLGSFGSKMPRELSGGMQQRASIVRALSSDPDVLLMDEPFGALDAFTRDEMNLLMEEIWLETRKTIVLITHSIQEAVFLSNKVHVMSARPGRMSRTFDVPFPRKRSLALTETREFFDLVNEIKSEIQHQPGVRRVAAAAAE